MDLGDQRDNAKDSLIHDSFGPTGFPSLIHESNPSRLSNVTNLGSRLLCLDEDVVDVDV